MRKWSMSTSDTAPLFRLKIWSIFKKLFYESSLFYRSSKWSSSIFLSIFPSSICTFLGGWSSLSPVLYHGRVGGKRYLLSGSALSQRWGSCGSGRAEMTVKTDLEGKGLQRSDEQMSCTTNRIVLWRHTNKTKVQHFSLQISLKYCSIMKTTFNFLSSSV